MWMLKDPEGKIFYLKPNSVTTVGRKNSDITLTNDNSISKSHASLTIQPQSKPLQNLSTSLLIVKDTDSKYGSSVISKNESKSKKVPKEGCILKHLDNIKFGLQENIFKVVYIPFVSAISKLKNENSAELASIMNKIDGVLLPSWNSQCTHLTTSDATLTEKVVYALVLGKPIVGLKYWKQVLNAIENNTELPDPKKFSLKINEDIIDKDVSLCPNIMRKNLFSNLIFIQFSVRQHRSYTGMITAAGGKSVQYTANKSIDLCAKHVIVLQLTTEETQYNDNVIKTYKLALQELKKHNRRMISETEIPLAILYCSTEQYCNPTYNFTKLLKVPQKNAKVQNSTILEIDTQDAEVKTESNSGKEACPMEIISETKEFFEDSTVLQSQKSSMSTSNVKKKVTCTVTSVQTQPEKSQCIIPETLESMEASRNSNNALCNQNNSDSTEDISLNVQNSVRTQDDELLSSRKRQRPDEVNELVSVNKKLCLENLSLNDPKKTSPVSEKEKKKNEPQKRKVVFDEWGFANVDNYDDVDFDDFDFDANDNGKKKASEREKKKNKPIKKVLDDLDDFTNNEKKEKEEKSKLKKKVVLDDWGFANVDDDEDNFDFGDFDFDTNKGDKKKKESVGDKALRVEKIKLKKSFQEEPLEKKNKVNSTSTTKSIKTEDIDDFDFDDFYVEQNIGESSKKGKESSAPNEKSKEFREKRKRSAEDDDESFKNKMEKKKREIEYGKGNINDKLGTNEIDSDSDSAYKKWEVELKNFPKNVKKDDSTSLLNTSILRPGIDLQSNNIPFGKTFKKIYKNMPAQRITLQI